MQLYPSILHLVRWSHITRSFWCFAFFFFNDTATTEIYTLSLHDALPISHKLSDADLLEVERRACPGAGACGGRSEEHTSELQSLAYLVCRLLLEKKKNLTKRHIHDVDHYAHHDSSHQHTLHGGRTLVT